VLRNLVSHSHLDLPAAPAAKCDLTNLHNLETNFVDDNEDKRTVTRAKLADNTSSLHQEVLFSKNSDVLASGDRGHCSASVNNNQFPLTSKLLDTAVSASANASSVVSDALSSYHRDMLASATSDLVAGGDVDLCQSKFHVVAGEDMLPSHELLENSSAELHEVSIQQVVDA